MIEFKITSNDANQRIDKFIRKALKEAPLSFIYRLFRKGDIKINHKKASIDKVLIENDIVRIYINEIKYQEFKKEIKLNSKQLNRLEVCFEDDNILAVNKSVGIEVQRNEEKTTLNLTQSVLEYLASKGEYKGDDVFVPSPAHRIDRNTSGIVLFGKNIKTLQTLLLIFKQSQIEKKYVALVQGHPLRDGQINSYLSKDSAENFVRIVSQSHKNAKEAILKYRVISYFRDCALVEVQPLTGRTHQIRVQMASIGHPLAGDRKYGDFEFNKQFDLKSQFLHAAELTFKSGNSFLNYMENITITANLPEKFHKIIQKLKLAEKKT